PGALDRAPPLVAPHQPRVDFQLWFYGLSFRGGPPEYVVNLVDRLCHDPEQVGALFRVAPPMRPRAVRLAFYRYHFTSRDERAKSGAIGRRPPPDETEPLACAGALP